MIVQDRDGIPLPSCRIEFYLPDSSGKRHRVCNLFFRDVLNVCTEFPRSCFRVEQGSRERAQPKAELVADWMMRLEKFHEYMPDLVGAGRREKTPDHPPSAALVAAPPVARHTGVQIPYPTKEDVYSHFVKELKEYQPELSASDIPTAEYFRIVWRERFPHIILRKSLRFAKCDMCIYWREMIGQISRRDAKEKEISKAHFFKHLTAVRAERECYHRKRREASTAGSSVLSIIFDGADQGSYGQLNSPEREL
jgi:hypothetical protein